MANVCLFIFFGVLNVSYFVTSSLVMVTDAPPGIYYIEELDEHKVAYSKMVSMRNGKKNKITPSEQLCHNAHDECLRVLPPADLVCAQHRRYGLVNFPSLCEVRFQNCLIKSREDTSGKKNRHGNFYYNGKLEGCEYYMAKTNTVTDAVKQYFMEDEDYKMRDFKENQQPQKRAKELIVV